MPAQDTPVIDLDAPPADTPRPPPRRPRRYAAVLALTVAALGVLPGEPNHPTSQDSAEGCDRYPAWARFIAMNKPETTRQMMVIDGATGEVLCVYHYRAR
ncbi:hypothetical protein [Micromonospora yangpuensis]|uniref:Uncharacterized protein n=1 Tax=Micromonospora yangpuensis TaxID=683228 RepID=A0A1C6U477_9ACTN|nr:hypothetical protein [Micromonospora yangpuensis]GGL92876.1 hypothetical protein GCM10012279_08170 [Micromonospora yangpuensis]SCL48856.1 hypothetical protein GA0070617_1001 [Micromonospora yangpuensis]